MSITLSAAGELVSLLPSCTLLYSILASAPGEHLMYETDSMAFERQMVHCHIDIAFSASGYARFAIELRFKDELVYFKLDSTLPCGIVSALRLNSDIFFECVVIIKIHLKQPSTVVDPNTLQNKSYRQNNIKYSCSKLLMTSY